MTPRSFWAARPLLFLLLLLAAAPLGAIRPDAAAGDARKSAAGCPSRLSKVGLLAAEPGVSMAIVRGGVTTTCVEGNRRAWSGDPVTPDTVFDAASLSKPLVAYAALRLVDEGRLDLNTPIQGRHGAYTLRQLLSHSAGFGNALSRHPLPSEPAGAFQYSGAGYILVGQMIENEVGIPFGQYMNTVVLPELGMTHSSFGADPKTTPLRASPSIDAGLVLGAFGLVAAATGLVLLASIALVFTLARGVEARRRTQAGWGAAATGVVVGLGVLSFMLGWRNLPSLGLVVVTFTLLVGCFSLFAERRNPVALTIRVAVLAAAAALLLLRPAVPLQLRNQTFLAPAGLRTTATDYARFLSLVGDPAGDPSTAVALMRVPAIEAAPDVDWTLGLGMRGGGEATLWHWGVNFPGYQSLALRWPDGSVAVVLVNGGALSLAPSAMRYSGLELAQGAVTELRNGDDQGRLWRDIQ